MLKTRPVPSAANRNFSRCSRSRPPNSSPPTNAAIKPLPPSDCAVAKQAIPRATTGTWFQIAVSQWRPAANRRSGTATPVSTTPTARPIPTSSASRRSARLPGPSACPTSCASARNNSRTGTQMPSFRPLSTLRPCLMSSGTASLLTTACPSAASVGASIVASSASSKRDSSTLSSHATPKPSAIVSGRPTSSNRTGSQAVLRSTFKLAPAASLNKTSARVNSASVFSVSRSVSNDNRSKPAGPISRPKAVNTIGPLILVCSMPPAKML